MQGVLGRESIAVFVVCASDFGVIEGYLESIEGYLVGWEGIASFDAGLYCIYRF
jgi:hypothetical protein